MDNLLMELIKADYPNAILLIRNFLDTSADKQASIDMFVNLLRGAPPSHHWAHKICYVLSQLGAEMEPTLESMVGDKTFSIEVRAHAVNALWFMNAKNAVPILTQALTDHEPDIRSSAAFGLGELKAKSALKVLMEAVLDDHPDVRSGALFALGQIADPAATKVIIPRLEDANEQVQAEAASALGLIGGDALLPLIKMIESTDLSHKRLAVGGLSTAQDTRVVMGLVAALADERVQTDAIESLVGIGALAVQPLIRCLSDCGNNPQQRAGAVRALAKIRSPEATRAILSVEADEQEAVRYALAVSMSILSRNEDVLVAFLKLLRDPSSKVKKAAATAAHSWVDKRLSVELLQLIRDIDPEVRWSAALSLEFCATPEAIVPLAESLLDPVQQVRFHAAVAIRRIGATISIIDTLCKALSDADPLVRSVVTQIVRDLHPSTAIPYLLPLLNDEHADVQKYAVQALVAIGTVEALTAVQEARSAPRKNGERGREKDR